MKRKYFSVLLALLVCGACDRNNLNILSVSDDLQLGAQVDEQIRADPNFDILDEGQYPQAYNYLRQLTSRVLASQAVVYRNEFAWQTYIIRDDSTLNAFCTPGGYIYVYTGLIKFLDTEDQLAGVMGHEIAHADLRHSSRQITRQYGFNTLISIVTGGDTSRLAEVASGLINLRYSREFEREADDQSVRYLADTDYQCDGAAGFFLKLNEAGSGAQLPEFLSTHPDPDNRIEAIRNKAQEISCDVTPLNPPTYQDFKNSLP